MGTVLRGEFTLGKTVENPPWKIKLRLPFLHILRRYYIKALHKFQICQPHFHYFFETVQFYLIIYLFFAWLKPKSAVFSLFRSSTDGNCLYNSIPVSLFGEDSMKKDLRILSSCRLFLHNNYYCEHPVYLNFVEKYNISLSRAFMFSVSLSTLNFDLPLCELVRKEAIKNCVDKSWASFLCILALSSVCNRSICSLYPDLGEKLFRDLFNCAIHPRGESITGQPNINILLCRSGITILRKKETTNFRQTILYQFLLMQVANRRKKSC